MQGKKDKDAQRRVGEGETNQIKKMGGGRGKEQRAETVIQTSDPPILVARS